MTEDSRQTSHSWAHLLVIIDCQDIQQITVLQLRIHSFQTWCFLAYFRYIEKMKVGLCDLHALCMSMYPPLSTFEWLNLY
jgi:hypothetical protein